MHKDKPFKPQARPTASKGLRWPPFRATLPSHRGSVASQLTVQFFIVAGLNWLDPTVIPTLGVFEDEGLRIFNVLDSVDWYPSTANLN